VAGLIAYLAQEVLPHAAAEGKTVYPAAAKHADIAGMVAEMTAEHVTLSALLAALLGQMHGGHEHARDDVPGPADAGQAGDSQAMVVTLLLQAAAALARAGEADRACTIAASAWAALRDDRPDLAARVTAALHGLARRVGPGGLAVGEPGAREDPVLDVRDLAPARRHTEIFSAYWDLASGAGFVLVNDHDPRPLRYQFEAQHSGEYTWDYLEAGPQVWRVRIGRSGA
jgi:uncharacterized protein (DUF2249 family)